MIRLLLVAAASLSLVSCPVRARAETAGPESGSRPLSQAEPDKDMLEHLDLLLDLEVVENLEMVELAPLLAGGHEPEEQGAKRGKQGRQ